VLPGERSAGTRLGIWRFPGDHARRLHPGCRYLRPPLYAAAAADAAVVGDSVVASRRDSAAVHPLELERPVVCGADRIGEWLRIHRLLGSLDTLLSARVAGCSHDAGRRDVRARLPRR